MVESARQRQRRRGSGCRPGPKPRELVGARVEQRGVDVGQDGVGAAHVPVDDTRRCGVEEPLQGDAHARGVRPDRLCEVRGDQHALGHLPGQHRDDAGEAFAAVAVDDCCRWLPGQRRHRARQRQVWVDLSGVPERLGFEVDEPGALGGVGHLEHVTPVDHRVEVAFAGEIGHLRGLVAPMLAKDRCAVVCPQPRSGAGKDVRLRRRLVAIGRPGARLVHDRLLVMRMTRIVAPRGDERLDPRAGSSLDARPRKRGTTRGSMVTDVARAFP